MRKFITIIFAALAVATASAQTEVADNGTTQPTESLPLAEVAAPEALLDLGNRAYIDGRFDEALNYYTSLLDKGLYSATLYYNTANAYFKCDQLAEAILYYNRALLLDPSMEDARYNLTLAEARTKDKIAVVPEFFLKRWVRSVQSVFDCTTWSILSLVSLALMGVFVLLFLLSRQLKARKAGFYGALMVAMLLFITTAFAIAERNDILLREDGVVMASAISVKSSPDRNATDQFVLHEGTKVRITTEIDGWYEIVIADGKKGWSEAKNIEKI